MRLEVGKRYINGWMERVRMEKIVVDEEPLILGHIGPKNYPHWYTLDGREVDRNDPERCLPKENNIVREHLNWSDFCVIKGYMKFVMRPVTDFSVELILNDTVHASSIVLDKEQLRSLLKCIKEVLGDAT